jgi:exonuclease SbcC
MRLHHLRLRAVGPFADTEHINFEQLGVGGLFLLDGPTGAGKSTVLDAITFALYGPGERAGDGRLHSQFASADAVPEVELEFSLRGLRQRITRSPEFTRPKHRGDGVTTQAARVHLERFEADRLGTETWVSRSSNKAEVAEMLADDLGLSRDQFTQVVLLPQGEFMKFLRAGDDDRRILLTRLFGTQLYDRITDELDRRRKVADGELAASDRTVRSRIAAAAEAAGLDLTRQDELLGLDAPARAERFDATAAELASAASTALAAAAVHAERLAQCKAEADESATASARAKRFAIAVEVFLAHESTRSEYEKAALVVSAAERAEPVRPLLTVLGEAEVALAQALAELPEDESSALPEAEIAARAAEALRSANELAPLLAREAEAGELARTVQLAATRVERAALTVADLDARQSELPAHRFAAEVAVQSAKLSASAAPGAHKQRAALTSQCEALRLLATIEPERQTALAIRESAQASYERLTQDYFDLVEMRLSTIAAELAAGLVDGAQCPVCGSAEHPRLASSATGTVPPDLIAQADEARRLAELERDAAVAAQAALEQRRAGLLAQAADGDLDALTAELGALDMSLRQAEQAAELLPGLERERANLEAEAVTLSVQLQRAVADHATALAELAGSQERCAALLDELSGAMGEYDSVASRVEAFKREAARLSRLAAAVGVVGAAGAACSIAGERAGAEALAAGFDTLAQARAAVLAPADLDGLRQVRAQWQAQSSRCSGALAVADFDGLSPEAAAEMNEAARRSAANAAAALVQAEGAHAEAALAAERAADAKARFNSRRGEVELATNAHAELTEAAAPVVHLARLARGVTGNRRVALTTYVLRQWFEQVVLAANTRLAGMSSGRYELVRVDQGSSKIERTGLTLQVLDHHTGEQRSPRSLSGGETFYTSLALALGLADVVRAEAGGVELDTLFIDEGFGSLDSDTLDSVMEVIDELRGRGRTVGIVSHVSELKDRIAERVEVRRKADGSSTLRVIA